MKLHSYFGQDGKRAQRCTYIYDFGDNWEHHVKLVRVFEEEAVFKRRLTDGARSFPPEDCGGTWGYEECVNAVKAKRKSKVFKERLEWLRDWKPESFDLGRASKQFNR